MAVNVLNYLKPSFVLSKSCQLAENKSKFILDNRSTRCFLLRSFVSKEDLTDSDDNSYLSCFIINSNFEGAWS